MDKKQKNDINAILNRAEELFKRGNFLLAKREFEKAGEELGIDHISEKIQICEKELELEKSKELIKKARKSLKKGDTAEAVKYFEQSYEITKEEWIGEKLRELKADLDVHHSFKAAKDAEALGKYDEAAKLYEKAFLTGDNKEILLKKASALVKAGKYAEAVSEFEALSPMRGQAGSFLDGLCGDAALYDYGFALAKTGKYYECLKIWDEIRSGSQAFEKQKSAVQALLAADLFDRIKRGEDEFVIIQGEYLKSIDNRYNIDDVVKSAKYSLIEKLWNAEQYEAILGLISENADMNADILALYAKLYYHLSENSAKYLNNLSLFWLTAVYHPKVFATISVGDADKEAVRDALIQTAESLIKKYADDGDKSAKTVLLKWNVEKSIIEDVYKLSQKKCPIPALGGKGDDVSQNVICTPQFAYRFGLSDRVLRLIQDSRDSFSDSEHYLATAAAYCPAGQSFLNVQAGEYEESFANLPPIDNKDELVQYCIERVNYAYGVYCMEIGDKRFLRYFESAPDLFAHSPKYEKEFTEKSIDIEKIDMLQRFEEALSQIYSKRRSESVRKALSLAMSRRCVLMYNRNQLNIKTAQNIMQKALNLDPENELILSSFEDMRIDIEIDELQKAIEKHKINKACQIAANSKYAEVKEAFFEFIEYNVSHIEESEDINHEKALLMLTDLSVWCARADKSNPIMRRINKMIRKLEKTK